MIDVCDCGTPYCTNCQPDAIVNCATGQRRHCAHCIDSCPCRDTRIGDAA